MIDDFRPRGSSSWRHMGVRLTNAGSDTWAGHDFNDHNASLSEGGALAVVVESCSETRHWKRDSTDLPSFLRPTEARLCLACPLLARRRAAPHGRGAGGGSDPRLFAADAPREGARPDKPPDTLPTSFRGSLPPQRSLAGRPSGAAEFRADQPIRLTLDSRQPDSRPSHP